ncbi:hypothetical protein [Agriterribacter sp.]|uniref:hypothetical protein n=1 Tax=Agriterribacter sp. TaxID=2821509 RepID=UPI002CEEF58E|nr:hypothetical protein [Agriterribacter sp.]HTN05704.1 hypothetical protein [Agriterribacter sp.]
MENNDIKSLVNKILTDALHNRHSITIVPVVQDGQPYCIKIDNRTYQTGAIKTEAGEILNMTILFSVFSPPLLTEQFFWINDFRSESVKLQSNTYQMVFFIDEESII